MDRVTGIILSIIALLVLCGCCLVVCAGLAAGVMFMADQPGDSGYGYAPLSNAGATPEVIRPDGPQSTPVPQDTRLTLEQSVVPVNDMLDLARRLEGKDNIPATLEAPARWYVVGDQRTFWVSNVDTNENFQVDATLEYATDHAYFWVENGVSFDNGEMRSLAEDFENNIYPTNREFFGSEWSPGVDSDPHIYILYAGGLGNSIAGYYSSADEYSPLAHEYSNSVEMFLFNSDNVGLDESFTYGVLAHEFQHMIHWYQDRNETSWLNEGFSELAALLNGYYDSGFDWEYARDPDMQLNDWPNDDDTTPHYGAGFLFVTYFLERFGEEATQALVANQNNGMASVNEVLADFNAVDPQTGQPITANDFFLDWVITNYLQDDRVGDGRFAYGGYGYDGPPNIDSTEDFSTCPLSTQARDVSQYGADFIRFTCPGDYTLHFEGSVKTGVLAEDPHSGSYYFWSNKGDESDMTLTRSFDFSAQSGPLTLNYWTWYDIEDGWDFLYLVASTDDGASWEILNTPSGTDEDPYGNGYGWGYSGRSGGWIQESVDISRFAGQNVQLRFEYVTDAAVNGEGLLLDDISVPEIGYSSDFENDNGGWEAAGWVRIQNALPQEFRLALITMGTDTTVQYITLNPDVSADIPISITGDVDEVVLVVTGTTQFTRQKAAYRFEVMP
ncbi:MAG TPA: immune inhibitor A [Anaerolineales bacterium]|nr:immune inhibitor A [Anaerolineales bacterium]